MTSSMCHIQRLDRHGGEKEKGYLWHAYPFPCAFSTGCLSRVMAIERSERWGLASDLVHCTLSPLSWQDWEGPMVHSPGKLCGRSRPGRALASRSGHVFMTAAKVHAMLSKPDTKELCSGGAGSSFGTSAGDH